MTEGGIFTILDNCLQEISKFAENKTVKVFALVNQKSKFNYPNIHYIEFPRSKKSWVARIYYEYFYFKKISKKIGPDVWLSLHDITPTVIAKKRFVYCHHPTMFYKLTYRDWKFDYKIGLFSLFYKYLYQINITKNNGVIVQQNWIKKEFESVFNIKNVLVSKPQFVEQLIEEKKELQIDKVHFLYPAYPRTFKNHEIIFDALQLLDPKIRMKIQFHFTAIKNNPSKYATFLYQKFKNVDEVVLWGKFEKSDRIELLKLYSSVDCLVFPSKLETWGLPISEAKAYKKPMLLANLPYAKETVGDYDDVSFFDVENPKELAQLITQFVNKKLRYDGNRSKLEEAATFKDWNSVFNYILKD